MHGSSLFFRVVTTAAMAAVCVLVTAWGPCAVLNRIPRSMHSEVYCGIGGSKSYWMNWGTCILDDRFQFFDSSHRSPGALSAMQGQPLSTANVLNVLPRTYTSYIRNDGAKAIDWPDYVYASGWPVRCATLALYSNAPRSGPSSTVGVDGLRLPFVRAAVPIGFHPFPVGIDLAAFAILVEFARFSVGRARAMRRIATGCCTACGYSLIGIDAPVCPECGTARRRVAAGKFPPHPLDK